MENPSGHANTLAVMLRYAAARSRRAGTLRAQMATGMNVNSASTSTR